MISAGMPGSDILYIGENGCVEKVLVFTRKRK